MEKYSGCGNLFYITMYDEELTNSEKVRDICKSDVDGLILVKTNPLTFRMYNRDGSVAKMCGNGIRCFTHYCYNHKLITNNTNEVDTLAGIYTTTITSTNPFMVKVNMVKPKYTYYDNKEYLNTPITINGITYNYSLVDTGVWHVVIPFTDKVKYDEAIEHIKEIYYCPEFNSNHNVNIVYINNGNIKLRTFEHGVDDFTKACGTGSTATFLILKKLGLVKEDTAIINNDGGPLTISLKDNVLTMTGESVILSK